MTTMQEELIDRSLKCEECGLMGDLKSDEENYHNIDSTGFCIDCEEQFEIDHLMKPLNNKK